jgi:DNA-binding HxlR family transcriptional regulator/putative sterol carrier protein
MRSYRQFCPAARALDVVGERWSLLVIRELVFGPKRYTDLQDGLPGIGPNVLADRIRSLESAGLVRKRRLPPPAASTVYELTELGSGLRPVLAELFRWGLQVIGTRSEEDTFKATWWLPAIEAAARSGSLPADVDDVYELRVGDDIITVAAKHGEVEARHGSSESPDVVIQTDQQTFVKMGRGRMSPSEAIESGSLSVEGDPTAAERCATLFGLPAPEAVPLSR